MCENVLIPSSTGHKSPSVVAVLKTCFNSWGMSFYPGIPVKLYAAIANAIDGRMCGF